jgi:hypothetical protein
LDAKILIEVVQRRRAENEKLLQENKESIAYYSNLLYEDDIILDLFSEAGATVMIPLKEWADEHGMADSTARQRAARGAFKTARKVGRDWMIDRSEERIDHRYK